MDQIVAESADAPAKPGKRNPFTREHQRQAALAKHRMSFKSTMSQALDLQRALHKAGVLMERDASTESTKDERARASQVLAGVAKGWQSMTDQIRILKGKPLPGSLRPEPKRKLRARERAEPLALPTVEVSKESL